MKANITTSHQERIDSFQRQLARAIRRLKQRTTTTQPGDCQHERAQ